MTMSDCSKDELVTMAEKEVLERIGKTLFGGSGISADGLAKMLRSAREDSDEIFLRHFGLVLCYDNLR